ncbi:MAG: GNAT family N-acetyltransferase [Lachnospiraceae bacterium]|nr:GNAT family N-acetyltransferase [Lachnospiraceae bacterium]
MKRICFASTSYVPGEDFVNSMKEQGIAVECGDCCAYSKKDTLLITDSKDIYLKNPDSLILINDISDMDSFLGAKYFVMYPGDCEPDYFIKIWQRINNIPWEIIETDRLIIRETTQEDVDTFFEIYKDPAMTLFNEKLYEDIEEEKKYALEYAEKVYKVQGFGIWTIIEKATNEVIGRAGLTVRAGFDDVEIGFLIGTAYQGQGYATEAVKACIEMAKKLEFESVYALVMEGNEPSKHILNKLGFLNSGIRKVNGIEYEYLQFKI